MTTTPNHAQALPQHAGATVISGPWPDVNVAEQERQDTIARGFVAARLIPSG